ncbi:methyltransferase family protein [Chryseobacterium arthrosphaerae]|uniref:methyltransferase family protein n=1 Tax=Chryseobacterium arthrosphaerae TaxID=651561 RepID=UPI001E5A78DA|nr:isoprenylcysteine carboxylmethyltransferase family protein [Chryseobacterium arthrosphaerae]UEQ76656.1 DUF1295 domain-containing protein [Chryseobacterium arthrosphaerae]
MALKEDFEQQGNWLFRYRSFLPIGILLIGLMVFIHSTLVHHALVCTDTYYEFIFLMVSLLGLGIRIYTVGYTPKNTSGRNTAEGQVADTLNTTGIYSIVRHPLYLGNFFMWLGPALYTRNPGFIIAFILFYWLYYERIMYAEERFLERKFGQKYIDWAKRTPTFIPDFRGFQKSNVNFSFKKVLKKEKNGLFAVFFIFALFDLVGELLRSHKDFNYFYFVGFVITLLLYVVLKILKVKTRYLEETR